MDYSRIQNSVDINIVKRSHIVIVGAGGSFSFINSLARIGIGMLTVIDYDIVEETNIVRQGYKQSDIGKFKVDALAQEVKSINPEVEFVGINKSFLDMTEEELDATFKGADLCLFLTDSFKVQAHGNIIALRYNKPAIWAGWYAQSRTAELFFQIPEHTCACFRCAASSRYKANEETEVVVSSNSNTVFHSMLLDSFIGMIALAILHRSKIDRTHYLPWSPEVKEYELFWDAFAFKHGTTPPNFFQFKAHPFGGNTLFDEAYFHLGIHSHNFVSYWQNAEAELKINGYDYDCPDCNGSLHHSVHTSNT